MTSLQLPVWGQTGNGRSGGRVSFSYGSPHKSLFHSFHSYLMSPYCGPAGSSGSDPSRQNLALVALTFLRENQQ